MSKNIVTVYSAKWCSACGPFKESLDRAGIEYKEVDMDDEGATKKAFEYGIRSLPAIVIYSPEGEVLLIDSGTGSLPKIKQLMQVNNNG